MPRYLISFDDGSMDHIPEEDWPSVGEASLAVVREARAAGVWIFGSGVQRQQATIVSTDGTITPGPVPETKAVIGGFAIIEVPSHEDALAWAARIARGCRCATPAFTKVRSVLAVPNLDASVDFYTRQLGMTIDFTAPGWAFLSRGNFRLMLGECPDALPAHELGDHSYFVYVTVEGIDALYAEFTDRSVSFTQPLASKPWGMREFGVRTPDGHRIMFGQEL